MMRPEKTNAYQETDDSKRADGKIICGACLKLKRHQIDSNIIMVLLKVAKFGSRQKMKLFQRMPQKYEYYERNS